MLRVVDASDRKGRLMMQHPRFDDDDDDNDGDNDCRTKCDSQLEQRRGENGLGKPKMGRLLEKK